MAETIEHCSPIDFAGLLSYLLLISCLCVFPPVAWDGGVCWISVLLANLNHSIVFPKMYSTNTPSSYWLCSILVFL